MSGAARWRGDRACIPAIGSPKRLPCVLRWGMLSNIPIEDVIVMFDINNPRFFIRLFVYLSLLSCVLLYGLRKARKGRKAQDDLLQRYADRLVRGAWYRVRYASRRRFTTMWKSVPWEADGILHIVDQEVTFYGYDHAGALREIAFPLDATTARWYGVRYWPNGLLHWFVLHAAGQEHYFTADTGSTVFNSRALTRDIWQRLQHALAGPGGAVVTATVPEAFALERNPYTVSALLLTGLIGFYAVVDFLLNTETYAEDPWYPLYAGVGGLTALLVAVGLLRVNIPKAESLALGVLLGLVLGLACYPGLLRLNQLTDTVGLLSYTYTLNEDLSLTPPEKHLPTLTFPSEQDYWAHFTPGTAHQFRLRHGKLGFYQVEMAPIYAQTRAYYADKDARERGRSR